jgi:hypothetical protein
VPPLAVPIFTFPFAKILIFSVPVVKPASPVKNLSPTALPAATSEYAPILALTPVPEPDASLASNCISPTTASNPNAVLVDSSLSIELFNELM